MIVPMANAAPRVQTLAMAAPAIPNVGSRPQPSISAGSRTSVTATDTTSRMNGVRVSPDARKVASIAKKP